LQQQTSWSPGRRHIPEQDERQHQPAMSAALVTIWVRCGTHLTCPKLNTTVNDSFPLSADPHTSSTIVVAKADSSGASNHYFKQADKKVLTEIRSTPFGPSVLLPDSTQIQASSTHSGKLPLHPSLYLPKPRLPIS
jgi:hypothetical protein